MDHILAHVIDIYKAIIHLTLILPSCMESLSILYELIISYSIASQLIYNLKIYSKLDIFPVCNKDLMKLVYNSCFSKAFRKYQEEFLDYMLTISRLSSCGVSCVASYNMLCVLPPVLPLFEYVHIWRNSRFHPLYYMVRVLQTLLLLPNFLNMHTR